MSEQEGSRVSEAQKQLQETRIYVPEGMYNVLELYKFIDELHLRMGQWSLRELED